MRDPLGVFGTLWPLVLLFPFLPGLPRPALGGLPWRQEFALALLLSVTTVLLLKRVLQSEHNPDFPAKSHTDLLALTIALFAAWTAASFLWAANPYSAVHHGFQWGAYLLFFILMRMVVARPRLLRSALFAFGSVVWMLGLSCLVEASIGAALVGDPIRVNSTPLLRGFSGFGEVMAVAAPLFAALALDSRKLRRALLCGATALVAWLAIVLSLERAPILGAAAALVLVLIGAGVKRGSRPYLLKRAVLLTASFALATVALVAPATVRDKSQDLTLVQRFKTTSLSESNTSVRLLFWGVGLEMFRAHPLVGVGANNYEVAFPWARANFSAAHPNSSLVEMNEEFLAQYAHNEYVQILAELGVVGVVLFLAFCLALGCTLWRALNAARKPLLVLGSGAGLLAFGVSSAASSFSFRWLGGGLAFFFAAALVSHVAAAGQNAPLEMRSSARPRLAFAFGSAFSVMMFLGAGAQATNSVMHAKAQSSVAPANAERFYQLAMHSNPFDASTQFDYGLFLYRQKRPQEALSHLRYSVASGLNTSGNYVFLAAAEEDAGDFAGAQRTLTEAVKAYPRSIFLLVRHAAALEREGKMEAAAAEFSNAVQLNPRAARGWYQLINCDIDAAIVASRQDTEIATPRELLPQQALFVVLEENQRRLNVSPSTGWRGVMKSLSN